MRMRSVFLIGSLLTLAACGAVGLKRESGAPLRHGAGAETLTARMALRMLPSRNGEQGTRVGIVILNPRAEPIQSVRAWIQYDPVLLTAQDLVIEEGRFVLFAPGERTIDSVLGMVKLGAAVAEPLLEQEILLASFVISERPRSERQHPVLTFYDWRAEGDGHTAVFSLRERLPMNILQLPTSLAL